MASLDVDALSTNIPLDETIDTCLKKLFKTPYTLVKGISKNDFRDLLNFAYCIIYLNKFIMINVLIDYSVRN